MGKGLMFPQPSYDPDCRIAIEPSAARTLAALPAEARVLICERMRVLSQLARSLSPLDLLGLQMELSGTPRLSVEVAGHRMEYEIDLHQRTLTVLAIDSTMGGQAPIPTAGAPA